jgi:branched-chain amino acid transport system permease protein
VLQYTIAGLVLGGIYAIASAGLVVTYLSAGILNFAFGSLAYFIARFYYFLHTQHAWGIGPAAVVSIVLTGPALGVVLYFVLFRNLRLAPPLIKIVATVGLSVIFPPAATLMFGNETILTAPGLAPQPVRVFRFLGVPVTLDQVIVYGCVIVIMVAGALILRYTDVGLRIRAMVDSPAMTSLSGTNPDAVSVGVWAASTLLAGLAGVLAAPVIGLGSADFTLLMAAAFAAVIAAKLRNLTVAVVVGLLMGVAGSLVQYALPPSSTFTADIIPSIPFVVTAIFLVYFILRSGRVSEGEGIGGTLDRAIAVSSDSHAHRRELAAGASRGSVALGWRGPILLLVVVALLPLVLHGLWLGLLATGIAYGILFLSFSFVIGEGGMVWLCMITFAGVGGLVAAQLATLHGWPVLAAVVAGGIVALPMGAIIGFLTIRLGDLYVALVTLTFGILMENLVFSLGTFANEGLGQNLNRPQFASGTYAFIYFLLVVFAIVALFVLNVRRSTTGMALTAVRSSEPAAKTIGVSVLQMKMVVAGTSAFLAGIGGALLGISLNSALPANYETVGGLVLIATVVTLGIRSNIAALLAGLAFIMIPALVQAYLPAWVGQVPAMLFGLGAVGIAQSPDGVLAMQTRQIRGVIQRWRPAAAEAPTQDGSGGSGVELARSEAELGQR